MVTTSPIVWSSWLFLFLWLFISLVSSVTTATLTLATVVIIFIVITFYLFVHSHFPSASIPIAAAATATATASESKSGSNNNNNNNNSHNSDADDSSVRSKGSNSTTKKSTSRRDSRSRRPSQSNRRKSSSCSSYLVDDELDDDISTTTTTSKNVRRSSQATRHAASTSSSSRHQQQQQQHLLQHQQHQQQHHHSNSTSSPGGSILPDGCSSDRRYMKDDEDDDPGEDDSNDLDTLESRDELIKRMVRSSRLSAYYKLKQHRQSLTYGSGHGFYNQGHYYQPHQSWYSGQMVHHSSMYHPRYYHQEYHNSPYYPAYYGQHSSHMSSHQQQHPHVHSSSSPSPSPYSYNTAATGTTTAHRSSHHHQQPISPGGSYNHNNSLHHGYGHQSRILSSPASASFAQSPIPPSYPQAYASSEFGGSNCGSNGSTRGSTLSDRHYNSATAASLAYSYGQGSNFEPTTARSRRLSSASSPGSLPIKFNSNSNLPQSSNSPHVPLSSPSSSSYQSFSQFTPSPSSSSSVQRANSGDQAQGVFHHQPHHQQQHYQQQLHQQPHHQSRGPPLMMSNASCSGSGSCNALGRSKSPPIAEEDDTASSTASPSSVLNSPAATTDSTLTQSSHSQANSAAPNVTANSASASTCSATTSPISASASSSSSTVTWTSSTSKLHSSGNLSRSEIIVSTDDADATIVPPSIPPRPRTLPKQLKPISDVINEEISIVDSEDADTFSDSLQSSLIAEVEIHDRPYVSDNVVVHCKKTTTDQQNKLAGDQIVHSLENLEQLIRDDHHHHHHHHQHHSHQETINQFITGTSLHQQGQGHHASSSQIRRGPWSLSADAAEVRIRKSRASLKRSNALNIPQSDLISLAEKGRIGKNNSTESAVSSTDLATDSCDSIHRQSSEEASDQLPPGILATGIASIAPSPTAVTTCSSTASTAAASASASGASTSVAATTGPGGIRIRPSFRKSTSLLKQAHLQNSSSFERDCSEGQSDAGTSISRSLSRQTTFSSITKDADRISARTGFLEISHTYDPPTKKLIITIIEATDLTLYPIRGLSGSISLGTGIDLSSGTDRNARRTPSPLTAPVSSSSTAQTSIMMANSLIIAGGSRVDASSLITAPSSATAASILSASKLKKSASSSSSGQSPHLILVRMALLPLKRNKVKTKGKCISLDGTVKFNEEFVFNRINPEEMIRMGCRFRVYLTTGKMRRQSLLGEATLPFVSAKPLQHETRTKLPLLSTRSSFLRANSRSSDIALLTRSESTCSTNSMYSTTNSTNKFHASELMLGLSFNGTSGRLVISVLRGSNMHSRNGPGSRSSPDSYVKLILVSSTGREIARNKTSIKKCQLNPVYKESFAFQVPLFELQDVTLLVHAYQKHNIHRKELIGWLALGANSSGEEQLAHWNDMMEAKGDQISRWHVLHSSKS